MHKLPMIAATVFMGLLRSHANLPFSESDPYMSTQNTLLRS